MGGRGASLSKGSSAIARKGLITELGNMSKASIAKLGRATLEKIFTEVVVATTMKSLGISEQEAYRRIRSIGTNPKNKLVNDIYKYTRKSRWR